MKCGFSQWLKNWGVVLGLAVAVTVSTPQATAYAQDKEPESKSDIKTSDDETNEEEDEFAVPADASVDELFAFMEKVQRVQPKTRDRASMTELAKKVFPAVIAAADIVLEKSESSEDQVKALSAKFNAYSILVRFDSSAEADVEALAEKYSSDERPELASIAVGYLLNKKAENARSATAEEANALADETLAFLTHFGLSKTTYGTASGIARNLGYSDHTEIAASLYERMVPFFRDSEDASLAERADMMAGAARRMRLMNNTMEVFGTTAAGEEFAWSDYRGKVVLVDFWASWCGPCMAELPNMKKNVELYGDKGFEIVGINMDSTREAFEKCVESKEITWVNLVSEEEGATGWKAPMATHYGITGIPTALLVDKDGKVVSLSARGAELDKQLEKLLGPAKAETENEGSGDQTKKISNEKSGNN